MRNGWLGLVGAVALVSAMATIGCGSSGGGGSGGSSSGGTVGSGGSSSTGGTVSSGGSSSSGGTVGSGGSSSSGGTGGGGSSGGSVTSISGTKALNALTTDEATQLCDDTYAYFRSTIPQATSCKWRGLYYATSSSAPTEEKLRQNCTSKETPCQTATPEAVWPNPGCQEIPPTCKATVAEYAACVSEHAADFTQTVSGLPTCATFTPVGTSKIWEATSADLPAACMSLTQKCPDLYPVNLFAS